MTTELSTDLQAVADKYQVQILGKVVYLSPTTEDIDVKPNLPQ